MNGYARLSHVKGDVAGVSKDPDPKIDPVYLRGIDAASREFERECYGRRFYSETRTHYFRGDGSRLLMLREDLATVTTLTVDADGDGTYELTLVADTDYWLAPYEAAERGDPYRQIELNPNGTQLTTWPKYPRSIKVAGTFGYPEITESAGTIAAAIESTTATAVTMTDGHTAEPGDAVKIDSEWLYVADVDGNTLTVQRGINGTTAATHLISAPVSIRRYPADIEQAIAARATQTRWDVNSGNPQGPFAGVGNTNVGTYARWKAAIGRHANWAAVL